MAADDSRDEVDPGDLELSNLDKPLFPDDPFTKGDLVAYYRRIAERALPYYRDRALTMQRFPDGIGAVGFYQKDAPAHFPRWIDRARLSKEGGSVTHVLVNKPATLVYLANLACITFHLSLARCDRPHHPDRMIFDLDPSDDDFAKVLSAARRLQSLLDELDLPSFVQTTGSRGLHVVVPLDRSAEFDRVRGFAREVSARLARRFPESLTVEHRKVERGDRVFLDYLRNAYGQHAVAPYAVRPLPGAPVATPVHRRELRGAKLHPRKYTIENLFRRLGQIEDPWASLEEQACSLDSAEKRLPDLG